MRECHEVYIWKNMKDRNFLAVKDNSTAGNAGIKKLKKLI